MVVNDFDLKCVAGFPDEANTVLLIYPNAMLTATIALESLESQADAVQIVQRARLIEEKESPEAYTFEGLEARNLFLIEESFGVTIFEASYHPKDMLLRLASYVKRITGGLKLWRSRQGSLLKMLEGRRLPEFLALLFLLVSALVVVQAYPGLPDMINTHFDALGRPDGIGPKSALWWTVGFAACIYIFVGNIGSLPAGLYRVTGKTFTPEGRARFVAMSRQSISWIKAQILVIFFLVTWTTVQSTTTSQPQLAETLLVYCFIALIVVTVAYYVIRSYRFT